MGKKFPPNLFNLYIKSLHILYSNDTQTPFFFQHLWHLVNRIKKVANSVEQMVSSINGQSCGQSNYMMNHNFTIFNVI